MIKWVLVIKDSVVVRSNLYIELPVSPYCPTARTREGKEVVLSCRETLNLSGLMICQDFFVSSTLVERSMMYAYHS